MLVVNWDCVDVHRNFVAGFVMEKSCRLDRLRSSDCNSQRTLCAAEFATCLVAVQQCLANAATANNFVARMSSDAFCSRAPVDDPLLQIKHAYPGQETLEDVATDLELVKSRHGFAVVVDEFIGQN